MGDPLFEKYMQVTGNLQVMQAQMSLVKFWSDELAKPRYADRKRLVGHGFKVFSQSDEDGIIQEIFNRIGTTNRTFIEIGVDAGIECNTVKLLMEGWSGVWMDASEGEAAQMRGKFSFIYDQLTLKEEHVTAENVNDLIFDAGFNEGEIDLLSIDVDNNDYWIWEAITAVYPRVVVIEYNATLRPPMSMVIPYDPTQKWDGSNFHGASLEALVKLGNRKGYDIVGCTLAGTNAFFVRRDLIQGNIPNPKAMIPGSVIRDYCFVQPATAQEHYEPPRYFLVYLQPGHPPRIGPSPYQVIE
jgi:hypothetical protein